MEFSRKEYWSGLPFPAQGDLPDPGLKLTSPAWQADSLTQSLLGRPKVNYRDKIRFLFVFFLSPAPVHTCYGIVFSIPR